MIILFHMLYKILVLHKLKMKSLNCLPYVNNTKCILVAVMFIILHDGRRCRISTLNKRYQYKKIACYGIL